MTDDSGGEDLLFRDENETVREAHQFLGSGDRDAAAWALQYERLLERYERLLSHTRRVTRISDLMQKQVHQLNDKLLEANQFQTQLLDTAITGIVEVDTGRVITKANQAFFSATGFRSSEVIGQPFARIFDSQQVEETCSLDCLPESFLSGVECTVRTKEGGSLIVLGNAASRRDASGAIVGGIVSIVDVTDLAAAREAAKAADRAKSDFLATVSHEIRTPLNAVLGTIELLLETHLSVEQRRQVEIMRTSAEALISLLNDLLDLSKIESGRLTLEEVDFSLRQTLSGPCSLLRMRASKKNLSFGVYIDRAVPEYLRGDPNRLRQIVFNLADNAIKFTHHGRVDIKLDIPEQADSSVVLNFAVSDTGIGISEDRHRQIFERFSQADTSMTRKYGGTGLGLAIVAELVKSMHGRVWVESHPGKGSTFHFTVRLKRGRKPVRTPLPRPGELPRQVSLKGLRVLLAEDNLINQLLTRDILKRQGCEVVIADNGREAVDAVESQRFDMILMDLQMPEMDGFEATRMIRQKEIGTRIPIIAQTAHAFPEDRERCLAAGMDDHITKPIKMADLLAILQKYDQSHVLEKPVKPEVCAGQPVTNPWEDARRCFDVDGLLNRLGNEKEKLRDTVDMFLDRIPGRMEEIRTALWAGDSAALAGVGRGLTREFAAFGADSLAEATEEVGKAASQSQLDRATVLVEMIDRQFTALHEAVMELRREL